MCGLAGIVQFDGGARHSIERARRMRREIKHRGPDDEGEATFDCAILEHTRLALLDPAGGKQPIATPDGRFTLVYNGEIYNHLELREKLDYRFRTHSDAETVLASFAVWGPACVERFNGMFAFAIWDNMEKRLFAARDPLGVKPFAYSWDGQELLFASEAHVVARAQKAPVRIHSESLLEYLVAPYFSGVEHSMFDRTMLLQPGHTMEVTRGGPETTRYFRFSVANREGAPHAPLLRQTLQRAVKRTCNADEPIGIFLSGGLDSTAIAAFAKGHSNAPSRAYTIAFENMAAFDYTRSSIVISDDTPFAEAASQFAQLPLSRVPARKEDLAQTIARVATANDALPAWEQEIAQYLLAEHAARDFKAVLVGDAADETHFGYHFLLDAAAIATPRTILERFGAVPIRADVLRDPISTFEQKYRRWMPEVEAREEQIANVTSLIVERWLPRLLHNGDIHTMRWGLEARVPFADIELLGLAATVPSSVGLAGGVEKAFLREALRQIVPEEIRTRRKSALPKDQSSAAVYKREAGRLLREPPATVSDFVDLTQIAPLIDPARSLTESERAILFRLISLGHFAHHHGLP